VTFPFGGLPENLTTFCGVLRADYGFRIGAGEVLDAARALDVVGISNERAVRNGLRAVLASSRDDAVVFDEAFDRFFFPSPSPLAPRRPPAPRAVPGGGRNGEGAEARSRAVDLASADVEDLPGPGRGEAMPLDSSDAAEAVRFARAAYSPIASESAERPLVSHAEETWVSAARVLVHRVRLGLSRRWRPASKGRRFDFRRTLRASLQTGGEALAPRWLGRPRRAPRFVVLIDGSRSMSAYTETALTVATALARVTARVEVFTFSTALQRITPDVRRAAAGRVGRLPGSSHAWGGGTRIGECLVEFLRRFGERSLGRNTVVIVASDGLDVGESATLSSAMRTLARESAAIVWLNPLAETPGYEPTALGMRTAKPFVTTFTSVKDLAGLSRLARTLRVKA
jgi:uncharacterized protein